MASAIPRVEPCLVAYVTRTVMWIASLGGSCDYEVGDATKERGPREPRSFVPNGYLSTRNRFTSAVCSHRSPSPTYLPAPIIAITPSAIAYTTCSSTNGLWSGLIGASV